MATVSQGSWRFHVKHALKQEGESVRRKKAQQEIGITDDGIFQNAFGHVDNEAMEAGQVNGGAPPPPRDLPAASRMLVG